MTFADFEVTAFSATAQPDRARLFYVETLGLELQDESPFAMTFQAGRTTLRVQKVSPFTPLPFTTLGWRAPDIAAAARHLEERGVRLERFEGMEQDSVGVWQSPSGAKVGWFKDPDGNLLSLTQL